jgi:hypothetical protein
MSRDNQDAWPRVKTTGEGRREPIGHFQSPDVIEKSDRSLAGPLRLGTAPGVGPKGALRPGASDFAMDRVSPRGFDPLGTSDTRLPAQEASELISREIRKGSGKRRGD